MNRLKTWILDRPRGEFAAHAGLVVLALVVRLIDLGDRPFHHDESQDAYFSWVFAERGDYHYQPILHGPLRFYLTALSYKLFGDSDFTARLAPALMGTLLVALPYLLRRQIGSIAAFAAAVALAVGPTYLYFSRFAREDIYFAAITMGLLVAVARYLDRPRRGGPVIIGILLALSFATKESTFITGFVATTFLVPMAIWQWRRGTGEIVEAVRAVGGAAWAYGLAAFALTFAIMFTVFFTRPDGLWDGIYEGLNYWLGQQDVGRGGEPWWFYIAILFAEEWPALLLGAVGAAWCVRHPTTTRLFLIWMFAMSLAVYSWASERFAWLVMHPLLPLLLLAGIGVQAIWTARRRVARVAGLAVVALGAAYMAYASVLVNTANRVDPREWLVSTQSAQDVKDVAERVRALGDVSINVDSGQGATFPYAWYFRDLDVGYIDMTTPGYEPTAQVLVMTEQAQAKLLPLLGAYEGTKFDFRVWWVRDRSKVLDLGAWWDWYTEREPWNPLGGLPEWIYVRRDLAD